MTARCEHRLADDPEGLRCVREPHPGRGHVYESSQLQTTGHHSNHDQGDAG